MKFDSKSKVQKALSVLVAAHTAGIRSAGSPTTRRQTIALGAAGAMARALVPLCLGLGGLPHAYAQDAFPQHSIRLVVPYQAGGSTDILARVVAEKLQERVGQPVVVDNKPGGNTSIATKFVGSSTPDGYTLLLLPTSTLSVPADRPGAFKPAEFTPVIKLSSVLTVLVANPKHNFKTVQDVVTYAKAHPGELTYAVSAVGGVDHFAGEMFNLRGGTNIRMIPYKGAAGATADVLAGTVDLRWDGYPSSRPHITANKLTLLGVAEPKRSPSMPEVPTIAEQGLPGFDMPGFFGVVGPVGMPAAVVAKLNSEMNAILQLPDVKSRMRDLGMDVVGGTPAQFQTAIKDNMDLWTRMIKETGIKIGD